MITWLSQIDKDQDRHKDNRPEGENVQEKVKTVQGKVETVQEKVETEMKTTSARDDERARDDVRVTVETWGDPGADGLAGSQPQGHQMRGGGKDRPRRVKKPVNKFV